MVTIERYHDISCGHRVVWQGGPCEHLHGHNYRIFFTVAPTTENDLDNVGRVIDFSVIKTLLCAWLERYWDHQMLIWEKDPMLGPLKRIEKSGVVVVPFNPTAENMARFLVEQVGPAVLPGYVRLVECRVEETRKCAGIWKVDE